MSFSCCFFKISFGKYSFWKPEAEINNTFFFSDKKKNVTSSLCCYDRPSIIKPWKSSRSRWARHLARMGENRTALIVTTSRPGEKGPIVDQSVGEQIMLVRTCGFGGTGWQDKVAMFDADVFMSSRWARRGLLLNKQASKLAV